MIDNQTFDFTELMKPQAIMIEPVIMYASLIEQQFGHLMYPVKKGIYKAGETYPVITDEKKYFVQKNVNGVLSLEPITDFQSIVDSVVDENGKLIIAQHHMKNKDRFLFSEPTIPVRGIGVIKSLVEEHISKLSPWTRSEGYSKRLRAHFLPEAVYEVVDECFLERVCESLLCKIDNFINTDVWNIYFCKIVAIDLRIEKCIDYRIYDWTLMKAGVDVNGDHVPRYSF